MRRLGTIMDLDRERFLPEFTLPTDDRVRHEGPPPSGERRALCTTRDAKRPNAGDYEATD